MADDYSDYNAWAEQVVPATGYVVDTINTTNTNLTNERIARQNREYQYNTAVEFWNMQNAYNNPKEAMARLREAGINPFVAAAQVANVNHAGEIATPSQQAIPYVSPPSMGSEFSQMAAALASLANARNTDVQTEELKQTLASKIERDILQTDSARLQHELDLAFKPLERSERMRELRTNIEKLSNESNLAMQQGNTSYMQMLLYDAERYLTQLKSQDQLIRNEFLPQYLQGVIDELKSKIFENYASANHHFASAREAISAAYEHDANAAYTQSQQSTVDALRDLQVTGQILDNGIKACQYKREFERIKYAAIDALNEAAKNGYISQKAHTEAQQKIMDLHFDSQDRLRNATPFGIIFQALGK